MDSLWHDLRYAVRGYVRAPFFTGVVLATLGLGIGAVVVIFSVINAVVLRPLAYPHAGDLVRVFHVQDATDTQSSVSPPNYFDIKNRNRAFAGIAAYWSPSVNISGPGGDPEKVLAATCSYDLFDVLGVHPPLGRAFLTEDDRPGARRVAVLGYGLWQRRFSGDAAVVGREIALDGNSTLVVGVMPKDFDFPVAGTELWVPLRISPTEPPNPAIPAASYRSYRILSLVARLKTDVSLAQARADMRGLAAALERQYPDTNHGMRAAVASLHEVVVGTIRPALYVLLAAVAGVLLIACANVSGLVLVRAASRSREIAVRGALGASRARLIRQALTESLVLSIVGGGVGLLLAVWGLDLVLKLAPEGIPRLDQVGIDAQVVAFTVTIATVAGLIFGLAPALQLGRSRQQETLRAGARGTLSGASQRTRQVLVMGQMAVSVVLLIASGLLIQSFVRLGHVSPGFRSSALLTLDRIELSRSRAAAGAGGAFFEELLSRIQQIPGIQSAGATLGLPLDPRARFFVDDSTFSIEGQAMLPVGERPAAPLHVVSPDYFATVGVPLKRGRWFDARDRSGAPGVVIINQAMAERYWKGADPIGRYLTHDLAIMPGQAATRQIVGVVGDVRHFGLDRVSEPQMFVPHLQMPWPSMALVVRTELPPEQVSASLRDAVWSMDRTIPVPPIRPMDQVVSETLGQPRFRSWLLGIFAGAALILAMVGLYGSMAYSVQQRMRELGLRLALGATPQQASRMVMASGLRLVAAGMVLGLVGATLATRVLSSMLFGVGTTDITTFVAVPLILIVVAGAACYIPARRVRHIEPMKALNLES